MYDHFQQKALKEGYLAYRQLMATHPLPGRFKNFTLKMTRAAIAIESRLDVRGAPKEGTRVGERGMDPTGPEQMFADLFRSGREIPPNKMIDVARAAQTSVNAEKARDALKNFLEVVNGKGRALDMDADIKMLGRYLAENVRGATWIDAPLKGLERAMGKTAKEEVNYEWGTNRDLVRGTMACDSEASLTAVVAMIRATCKSKFAMKLVKDESQCPVGDKSRDKKGVEVEGKSKTGYSGYNFAVVFREHVAFAAELQANNYDVLYGKMDQKEFCLQLQMSLPVYAAKQAALKFPGGLGHGLYEIQDKRTVGVTPDEAERARSLSCSYYDVCRGNFRKDISVVKLNKAIMEFGPSLTSPAAIKIWRHCCNGSAWPALVQQAVPRQPFRSGG
ncbi:MAG: hypothetical protein JWP87_6176 [Labilithrix sp.]|nr:hypothetical protein [Labilithrix sp.]